MTMVRGVPTYENGVATGNLPGRLVRSPSVMAGKQRTGLAPVPPEFSAQVATTNTDMLDALGLANVWGAACASSGGGGGGGAERGVGEQRRAAALAQLEQWRWDLAPEPHRDAAGGGGQEAPAGRQIVSSEWVTVATNRGPQKTFPTHT